MRTDTPHAAQSKYAGADGDAGNGVDEAEVVVEAKAHEDRHPSKT